MIFLKPMSAETFESFKRDSKTAYATNLASVEVIPLEVALKSASEQFDKLVPTGTDTQGQSFFEVLETGSGNPVGYLWLGIQNRFDRKVVSINDITISPLTQRAAWQVGDESLLSKRPGKPTPLASVYMSSTAMKLRRTSTLPWALSQQT
ncbi:MAG: hypothetical protein IPM97_08190 [Bdellovibrionaceae bacterium]|nr:hypothetical protein [Pseudobdellovibrionaceae bacterium]